MSSSLTLCGDILFLSELLWASFWFVHRVTDPDMDNRTAYFTS